MSAEEKKAAPASQAEAGLTDLNDERINRGAPSSVKIENAKNASTIGSEKGCNSRMHLFSLIAHIRITKGPFATVDLATFIDHIRAGQWAEPVQRMRAILEREAENDDDKERIKAEAKRIKEQLPAVLPSGVFDKRSNEGLRERTGLICADLDALGDQLPSYRQQIEADPHTLACFLSPSGTGLKVLLRLDLNRSHEDGFRAMRRHFIERFGVPVDEACKDVSRACFVSYDPDAFLAEDAQVLPYPPEPVPFAAPEEKMPGARMIEGTRPGDDYDARGDFFALLRRHGWTSMDDGGKRWTRPGKTRGVSATWGEVPGRLYVFSSNAAPLEAGKTYKPWHVFALLEHGGDFKAAGRALAAQGYGEQRTRTVSTDRNLGDGIEPGSATITTEPMPLWPPSRFLAYPDDPGAYLLGDGYLERGAWTSLVGVGGLGKTRLALWLAVCLITGRDWLGLKAGPKPPRVVFLSSENVIRRWKRDLSKMIAQMSEEHRSALEEKLLILALLPDAECDLRPNDSEGAARMVATLAAAAPDLVIFDPLADMIDGEESKTGDMIKTLRALGDVQRQGCPDAALLVIHHSRSGADNVAMAGDRFNAGGYARGSKAFYSRVRCEMQLAPGHKDDGRLLVLACGKANNTEMFTPRGVVFDPETATYSVDPAFDYQTWRDNVQGKRRSTAVTIEDVVNVVRELAPQIGAETTRKAVIEQLEATGAAKRTIGERIKQGVSMGFLRKGKRRWDIKLGTKPCPSST